MPRMLYEKYLPCKVILCLSEIQRHLYFYLLNLTTCAQEQGSPGFACQLCSWRWCWLHFWGLCSRLHAGWSGLGSDQSAGGREKAKCFWTIFGSGRLSSRVPASARRPAVDLELHRRVSCSFHPRLSVSLRLCITKVTHWAQEACPLPFSVMFLWFIRVVVCMRNSFLLCFFQLYWDIIGIQYCVSLRYTIDRFGAFASDYHHITTITSHNCPFFFVVENTAGLLFLVWHRIINCAHHSVHSIPRTYSSNIWKFVPLGQHHPYSLSPSLWQPTVSFCELSFL